MAVINCKERAPGPVLNLLKLWLDDIQNNGDPVFVVVPDDALVGVGRVATDNSVLFASKLCRVVRLDEALDLLLLHLHVLLLLLNGHYETPVRCQLVLALGLLHP